MVTVTLSDILKSAADFAQSADPEVGVNFSDYERFKQKLYENDLYGHERDLADALMV